MILNGEHQSSQTVLNGKPLTGYDRAKLQKNRQHRWIHQQLTQKYRTPKFSRQEKTTEDRIFRPSTLIIVVVFWILFLTVMGSIIQFARMVSQ